MLCFFARSDEEELSEKSLVPSERCVCFRRSDERVEMGGVGPRRNSSERERAESAVTDCEGRGIALAGRLVFLCGPGRSFSLCCRLPHRHGARGRLQVYVWI